MKLFYRLILLLAGLTFIASCSEDDFDRKPVLQILDKTLSFTKEAGEKGVNVEINDGDELNHTISASGIDWIKVTNTKDGLSVSVLENKTPTTREATIKVLLLKGALSETISVSQAHGEFYINVSKEKIELGNQDSEYTILIESNIEWTPSMSSNITWLTIDQNQKEKNQLTFIATGNPDNNLRIAEVKLTGSGAERIVTIAQKGVMYYDFPFMEMGYIFEGEESERGIRYKNGLVDANKFELARGSALKRIFNGKVFFYATESPIFPVVEYTVHSFGNTNLSSITTVVLPTDEDPLAILQDPAFLEYLKYEGFEFAWKDDAISQSVYWNKERQIALMVAGENDTEATYLLAFTYSRVKPSDPNNQTSAYKTFSVLPAFYTEWGATVEQIRAWESSKGSKFLPGDSSGDFVLAFAPDPTLEPDIVERIYTMDKTVSPTKLIRTLLLFNRAEKALIPTGAIPKYASNIPSNEYRALMLANGYDYFGQGPYSPVFEFRNSSKELLCKIAIQNYPNEGYIPRLSMEISPLVDEGDK